MTNINLSPPNLHAHRTAAYLLNTGDNAAAYEQRIHAAFRMLRKANDVSSESRILEKMCNQLGG